MQQNNEFKKGFYSNVLKLGSYQYSSEALSFLSSIILARLLLPKEYGFVALISVVTDFAMIFAGAGIASEIIRSDYGFTFHKAMANLSMIIGLGLCLFTCMLAYPLALFYDNMNLIYPTMIISTQIIFRCMQLAPQALLQKQLKFNYIGKLTFFTTFFTIVMMIVLALLDFSYWALIIPFPVTHFVKYILISRKTGLPFRIYPWKYTVVAFRKSKSIIGNITGFKLINYWARNVDNILIGKIYGEASLGIYNRGYRFLSLSLKLIARLFDTVLYPSLKKLQDQGGLVRKEYLNILGIISLINFPVGLVLILFPQTFVRIMWGPNWMQVADLLPYFGLLVMSQTIMSTAGNLFILFKKERVLLIMGTISAALMVGAIAWGSFYSMLHVARYYTLTYLTLIIPITLFFGFIKACGYNIASLLPFWLPKLILSLGLLTSIWSDHYVITCILMGIYLLHLLHFQRNEIMLFSQFTIRKFHKFVVNGK